MDQPVIARRKPYLVEVTAGKRYFWCACGLSKKQPYCDGSHSGSGIEPVQFRPEEDGELLFCGCKRTGAPPICDGTHNSLTETYAEADPASMAHVDEIPRVAGGGKTMLDGGCYVRKFDAHIAEVRGNLKVAAMIADGDGARYLSAHALEAGPGTTPLMSYGKSDVALFVLAGAGSLSIADQKFPFGPECALYVRPDEAFAIENAGTDCIRLLAVVCPQGNPPTWPDEAGGTFDDAVPVRSVPLDPSEREPMADRFFQVLVGAHMPGAEATMFIGDVPKSRAEYHHHLYEEVITVLAGEGYMWTQTKKTAVGPGDVIFLPKKQVHSLECATDEDMRLVGAFYPAGSPAINY